MSEKLLSGMIRSLTSLPGIGEKSAYRIAFHLIRMDEVSFRGFLDGIRETKEKLVFCSECGGITDQDVCATCSSASRDQQTICVVEDPEDIFFLEKTQEFKGIYHVLNGVISPIDGVGPEELRIRELLVRIQSGKGNGEILIATNPTIEGDATADYIHSLLKDSGIKITRLAYGITVGGAIEFSDQYTLGRAIRSRLNL